MLVRNKAILKPFDHHFFFMRYLILPVTPYQQNCSFLICEQTQKTAIVDPGGDIDLILEWVEREQLIADCILVTHGHLDHVGGVKKLADQLQLPIIGPHIEDKFWINQVPEQCQMFGFPPSEAFTPQRWLSDGDTITFGQETLTAIHCPGHTPGHIVFYHPEDKLAVVGDVLFKGSIGRTDFPKGDYQTLLDSIHNKLWTLGGDIDFIPGHGEMSSFKQEMLTNPFVAVN